MASLKSEHSFPQRIGVIGGGLAGLSTIFHLLDKSQQQGHSIELTLFDRAPLGTSGASSVAGGFVHPLSPRGKLVYMGLEGLQATSKLVRASTEASSLLPIVLRQEMYRIALTQAHVQQLQETARELPLFTEWLDATGTMSIVGNLSSEQVLGALRLHGDCRVLHVPSYLRGLWKACERKAAQSNSRLDLKTSEDMEGLIHKSILDFDAVVLAGGSGMFDGLISAKSLPIQLVRGQSIELEQKMYTNQRNIPALLCGKYLSPLPDPKYVLIGATHEFRSDALSREDLVADLKERTKAMCGDIWNSCSVARVTEGYRVQSHRGRHGRQPIVGRWTEPLFPDSSTPAHHANAWIFTGLSSRGLLYHGLFGERLADAVLWNDEDLLVFQDRQKMKWWNLIDS